MLYYRSNPIHVSRQVFVTLNLKSVFVFLLLHFNNIVQVHGSLARFWTAIHTLFPVPAANMLSHASETAQDKIKLLKHLPSLAELSISSSGTS